MIVAGGGRTSPGGIDGDDEGRLLAVPGVRGTGIFAGYAYERYAGDAA